MKKIALFSMFVAGLIYGADAAVPQQRRSGGQATQQTAGKATTARSAISARSAVRTPADSAGGVVRSGRTTVARSATPATSSASTVVARAAKQNVVAKGTKVQAAAKNVIVSEECQAKYDGCMDAFCMLDNETGGRGICSNRNAELDDILAQIEELDQMSYQMATAGVERLEMGADADLAMKMAKEAADKAIEDQKKEERASARRELDLSMWDTDVLEFDAELDIFADGGASGIEGKTGDALHNAASAVCAEQMPECEAELGMLKMLYAQRVRSDCAAYENSLNAQKKASANKLAAAEQALRQTALDQYRSANKYDLGQCTVKFKECMIETGECGEDFSKCATIAAMDSTNAVKSTSGSKVKRYKIQGSATTIEIYASTYDTLLAKKPLCEHVTKECINVAGQVWETFLKEVAPQVKSAEIIAEDKVRQDCIGNISSCFQKACKDSMDPNDPDGSYDMCLSRPETMLNVCKIPLNACGIDTARATESTIWDFVVARLASIRVDACTDEIKSCLQSEDRCGEDYTQCVGLDTDVIVDMCPRDKLTACMEKYSDDSAGRNIDVEEYMASVINGILLNIDNSLQDQCQKAVDEAMIRVCGATENCDGLTIDEYVGANSLGYQICKITDAGEAEECFTDIAQIPDSYFGRAGEGNLTAEIAKFEGRITGQIPWEDVTFETMVSNSGKATLAITDFLDFDSDKADDKAKSEVDILENNIALAVETIEADQTITWCMTGRDIQGMRTGVDKDGKTTRNDMESGGRYPGLTQQMRILVANSAIKRAKDNYYEKFDELNKRMLQDYVAINEKIAEAKGQNALDARRDAAQAACVGYAAASSLPITAVKKSGNSGTTSGEADDLVGSSSVNLWNYKETVTSTFDPVTLICHKCTRSQQCTKPKGGRKFCKKWADEVETCVDTQF